MPKVRRLLRSALGPALPAGLALLLTACGSVAAPGALPTGTPASTSARTPTAAKDDASGVAAAKLGFTRYPGAVQWPSDTGYLAPGEGLQLLLPAGGCVLGLGTYRDGYGEVTANWRGNAACTSLRLDPPPSATAGAGDAPPGVAGQWRGGGIAARAAIRWTDGSLIAVTDHVERFWPDGRSRGLASLGLPVPADPHSESEDQGDVYALARVGQRLLIGGEEMIDHRSGPVLWTSDDAGATVHRVALPMPAGTAGRTSVSALAVDGRTVVAVGGSATNYANRAPQGDLPVWYSTDAGSHWRVTLAQGIPPEADVRGLLHDRDGWIAYGGVYGVANPDRPLVLTSPDGITWRHADDAPMGAGDVVAGTVDRAGLPILVGSEPLLGAPSSARRSCGVVWLRGRTAADWLRGSLGCGEAPPTAAATLADGRVLIAGNRDLWLRH